MYVDDDYRLRTRSQNLLLWGVISLGWHKRAPAKTTVVDFWKIAPLFYTLLIFVEYILQLQEKELKKISSNYFKALLT